jgi:parallel beta-helix repeat protein
MDADRVTIGHVGDSRCYQLRPGQIFKLTHDHSPVGEIEDRGDLHESAAMAHPRRNEIFRDVGSEEHAPEDRDFIEIVAADFTPDAALLLCSDGLTDQVGAEEIRRVVEARAGDPEGAARTLIEAANAAGGKDNTSIIIVEAPQYAARVHASGAPAVQDRPSPLALRRRRAWRSALAMFLIGLGCALAGFLLLKPHYERGATGAAIRFGEVRLPSVLAVGPGHPFPTISAALAAAVSGDRISVVPGVYRESIALKDGVAVESAQLHGAVLESEGVAVLAENAGGATFSGFRIRRDPARPLETGVRLLDATVVISATEISGASDAGVEIVGSSKSIVMACRIAGNSGTGVVIRESAMPTLLNNVIEDNGRHSDPPEPGVHIYGAADPLLQGNMIFNNGAEPLWVSPLIGTEDLLRRNFFGPAPVGRRRPPLVRVVQ